ncbi:hypothetical protein EF919_40470 [Streptomyces sp. WAC02707]|uniref:hypothetical protein n=1 Tax=Streptomyces sp. WAC02707 TaxID=2487417 RepID=UPI000F7ADB44|nr:hypothetical protein [Streptomyces sp. WAC02707]RSS80744.1 hypothetical protein EF919_40470 [Streptomyces sp. WAC02707]
MNRIGPAGPDTLEALLTARAPGDAEARLLDLRSRTHEEWTRRTYPTRTHGAYVTRFLYRLNTMPVVPGEEYDGPAYAPVSTPSRPL